MVISEPLLALIVAPPGYVQAGEHLAIQIYLSPGRFRRGESQPVDPYPQLHMRIQQIGGHESPQIRLLHQRLGTAGVALNRLFRRRQGCAQQSEVRLGSVSNDLVRLNALTPFHLAADIRHYATSLSGSIIRLGGLCPGCGAGGIIFLCRCYPASGQQQDAQQGGKNAA